MSVISTYKTLLDLRRDRRYPVPVLRVSLLGESYETVNWSMGGLLISNFKKKLVAGASIRGTLQVLPGGPELPFEGHITRSVGLGGQLALSFDTRDPEIISELDRGMSRRLRRSSTEAASKPVA